MLKRAQKHFWCPQPTALSRGDTFMTLSSGAYILPSNIPRLPRNRSMYRVTICDKLFLTSRLHQNWHFVLVHGPNTKSELLSWCQREVGNNVNGHPVCTLPNSPFLRQMNEGQIEASLQNTMLTKNNWSLVFYICLIVMNSIQTIL